MREHDQLLMLAAVVALIFFAGAAIIEWLFKRKQDRWIAEFEDSATVSAADAERERFWAFVQSAEGARLKHLDESEAAAIAHQRTAIEQ